jgi:hypothetical protein
MFWIFSDNQRIDMLAECDTETGGLKMLPAMDSLTCRKTILKGG